MTGEEAAAANRATIMDDALHARLTAWVERHYRDRLAGADLADPALLTECCAALDELTRILALDNVYAFQR